MSAAQYTGYGQGMFIGGGVVVLVLIILLVVLLIR